MTEKYRKENAYILASSLDLRFAGFPDTHRSAEQFEASISQFMKDTSDRDFMKKFVTPSNGSSNGNRATVPKSTTKFQKRYGSLLDDQVDESPSPQKSIILKELELYLKLERLSESEQDTFDLLAWWKKHENMFPTLAIVARKVHGIVATSAESERMWNVCGNIKTKKRSNILPSNLNVFSFLTKNLWEQEEEIIDDEDVPEDLYAEVANNSTT